MGFAMHQYIILLSDLSYEHGLIGIAEYKERREVAHWLSVDEQGQQDPRDSRHEEPGRLREFDEERGDNRGAPVLATTQRKTQPINGRDSSR